MHLSDSRRKITRRDFLNGFLMATAAAAVGQPAITGAEPISGACDGSIGGDLRALRGGNLPAAFDIAHWLRDRRLRFEAGSVTLTPGCDSQEGTFRISDDDRSFDVVVVGGGLSGLSAAFFLMRHRPATRILLLDANGSIGGNAGRDAGPPLPVVASTAGCYCAAPSSDHLREFYREIGVRWQEHKIPDPMYSYFFDENTPGRRPGYRGWNVDTYGKGLKDVPYPRHVADDLIRCQTNFRAWARRDGGPTDPPDQSRPEFDYLSRMTLETYLTGTLKCDPTVSDFYTRYTIDCLGGTSSQVNAHSSISFLSSDYANELFAFPGGTSELAQRLSRWLQHPDRARQKGSGPEIRLNAVGLRIDAGTGREVRVTYYADKAFRRVAAKAVIVASQASSARRLVDHLIDETRRNAFGELNTVPVVVANVGIASAAPFVELGLGYNQYFWGSRHWADFVVADWVTGRREKRDRPTVLTFIGGNLAPAEELAQERIKLLQTPFADYEASLKADLSRIMAGTRFDFDRDVTSISVYRWGHSMIMPTTSSVFGDTLRADGRLDREKSPRRVACRPLGRISFAGQDSEGSASVESAIGSGFRTAAEVIDLL